MTPDEIFEEATAVYDNYVDVLETGSVEALQAYAHNLSERIIPRGVETHEVLGSCSSCAMCSPGRSSRSTSADFNNLNRCWTRTSRPPTASPPRSRQLRPGARARHPPAAGGHPRALTPVLQVRERLLILPIIGVLDGARAVHRAAAARNPHEPGQLRRDRHHRRPGDRLDGGQPPRPDGRASRLMGATRDHHRTLGRDRPDAGQYRCRSEQDERGR